MDKSNFKPCIYLFYDEENKSLLQKLVDITSQKGFEIISELIECGDSDKITSISDYIGQKVAGLNKENFTDNLKNLAVILSNEYIIFPSILNKNKLIRAVNAGSIDEASTTRQHNNTNILTIGLSGFSEKDCIEIVDKFITTSYSLEERHSRRILKLSQK